MSALPSRESKKARRFRMTNQILNFLGRLHKDEAGQGLVEYVMIFGIVAFGTTAGMGSLASTINSTFVVISAIFGRYIT